MSVLIDGLPSMPKTSSLFFFSIRVHISLSLFILKPDGLSDHALVIYNREFKIYCSYALEHNSFTFTYS